MNKLKTITAIFLVALISLTFLVGPPGLLANSEENVCEIIYSRCISQALAADQSLLATYAALENCGIIFTACQIFMTIRLR
ncbi:MAG: hypothetical protein H5U05_08180 [Candidatus Aminicenantes bacterium]|nr:hypothetical protein [Candidatus Aminicenantes bacterium]